MNKTIYRRHCAVLNIIGINSIEGLSYLSTSVVDAGCKLHAKNIVQESWIDTVLDDKALDTESDMKLKTVVLTEYFTRSLFHFPVLRDLYAHKLWDEFGRLLHHLSSDVVRLGDVRRVCELIFEATMHISDLHPYIYKTMIRGQFQQMLILTNIFLCESNKSAPSTVKDIVADAILEIFQSSLEINILSYVIIHRYKNYNRSCYEENEAIFEIERILSEERPDGSGMGTMDILYTIMDRTGMSV